jgi:hypothetical protein
VAADQYLPPQPPFRHHRRPGRRAIRPLRRPPASPRPGPFDHLLPLVAQADPYTTRSKTELISCIVRGRAVGSA